MRFRTLSACRWLLFILRMKLSKIIEALFVKGEARRVAAQIARLPTLLRNEKGIEQGEA
jgi:hypothetical protein